MAMIVKCVACGASKIRPPSQIRGRVFCSIACRRAASRSLLTCAGCAAQFARDPKRPNRRYCSWLCYKRSRHLTITCQVCGEQFDSYLSEHRRRISRGHVSCCSRACRNVYTSRFLGGDGTWTSGGSYPLKRQRGYRWRQIRAEYLALVGGICEGCEGAPATQVHHLHQVADGGSLYAFDNLMAVCAACHENMHAQLRAGAFWCSLQAVRGAA